MAEYKIDPSYKEVPERIREFRALYPNGCLRAADPSQPYRLETVGSQTYLAYIAAAYRSPDDEAPGIGAAWEPVPGRTPYTKDSELQNAETSAWGRAIVAVLASDAKKIASQEDVQVANAREEERRRCVALRTEVAKIATARGWEVEALQREFAVTYGHPTGRATAEELEEFLGDLQRRDETPEPTPSPGLTPDPSVPEDTIGQDEAPTAARTPMDVRNEALAVAGTEKSSTVLPTLLGEVRRNKWHLTEVPNAMGEVTKLATLIASLMDPAAARREGA